MEQEYASSILKPVRVPWNKGKLVGAKPPLRPSHVWSIRTRPVRFELMDQTRMAIDDYLRLTGRKPAVPVRRTWRQGRLDDAAVRPACPRVGSEHWA